MMVSVYTYHFCHCGVESETAMIGKEVRGGADVDHNDE
jgi:hypothetical protein